MSPERVRGKGAGDQGRMADDGLRVGVAVVGVGVVHAALHQAPESVIGS